MLEDGRDLVRPAPGHGRVEDRLLLRVGAQGLPRADAVDVLEDRVPGAYGVREPLPAGEVRQLGLHQREVAQSARVADRQGAPAVGDGDQVAGGGRRA